MKSIRRRLIVWLLPGFAVLWLAGGSAVYVMFRASQIARVDEQLEDAQRSVRLMVVSEGSDDSTGAGRGPKRHRVRREEFDEPGSGYYYEVFSGGGLLVERSPSLAGRTLPEAKAGGGPGTVRMVNGEALRMVAGRLDEGGRSGFRRGRGPDRRQTGTAVVAISLEEVNRSLAGLVTGMVVTGAAGAAAGALLIGLALRDGLKPLRVLGREVARIAPQSLSKRFSSEGIPREVEPIVHRLNGLLDRLEAGFHRERRFSADLAHELRTPLAEARSIIEMGLRYPDEINAGQQRGILDAGKRMERIVEAMLQLARCEATAASSDEEIGLRSLVEQCWKPHAASAGQRNIQLQVELPANFTVRGSPELWSLLAGNLISNAAEYAPDGSTVCVTANGWAFLEVANPAPNMRHQDLGKMFDRLWRADRARSSDEHSGLGLSIARACAGGLGVSLKASLDDQCRLVMRIGADQGG